ncbi:MAG: hypothetical protein ACK568_13045 [Pseudanabaena sp.]
MSASNQNQQPVIAHSSPHQKAITLNQVSNQRSAPTHQKEVLSF